jgi:Mn2+/Fe2+ NRAMP family transporter
MAHDVGHAWRRGPRHDHIDPIAMLFWAAVLNGIVSVPIMAAMMFAVCGNSHPQLRLPRWLRFLGWLATALMTIAVGAFAWTSI